MEKEEEILFVEKALGIYESFEYDSVNKTECIRAYQEWYAKASVLFNKYIDGNDRHLLKFESVDNSGNGYSLRENYKDIYASYCVLMETVRTMKNEEPISVVKEDVSQYGEVILYQPNEDIKLEVKLDAETVWLTQQQIADLFGTQRPAITKHLSNIFKSGELDEKSVSSILEHTAVDKKIYKTKFYNLDAILSVGYRVNSKNATMFRRWATSVLKEHLLRGFSINRRLVSLQQQIDSRFNHIEKKVEEQQQQVDFLVTMHKQPSGKLFDTGCVFDAYAYMVELISLAEKSIILVDNYCNAKTLTLLDNRKEGVEAIIYTKYDKKFEDALEQHNKQYPEIKRVQVPHKFHDRFLIVDRIVYILGNSLKDMGNTLSAVLPTPFTSEEVLSKLK